MKTPSTPLLKMSCASADVVSAAFDKLAIATEAVRAEAPSHVRIDFVFMIHPMVSGVVSFVSITCKCLCRDDLRLAERQSFSRKNYPRFRSRTSQVFVN